MPKTWYYCNMTISQKQDFIIHQRSLILALFAFCIFLFPNDSHAIDYGSYTTTFTSFQSFLTNVNTYLAKILGPGTNATKFIEAEFLAFMIYRLSVEVAKWVFNASDIVGVFAVIMLGGIVKIMMNFYDPLTTLLLSWAGDASTAIQKPIVGNDDVFFIASYIHNIMQSMSLPETTIFSGVATLLLIASLNLLIWILSLLAFFTVAWGIWGYALTKLVGWFFLPFLMLKRTEALFDGWLKLFLGFLFYMFIARANIVLVLVLLTGFFGLALNPSGTGTVPPAVLIGFKGFDEVAGLAALLIVSILALLSSGKFAVALAGGVGGFGGAAATLAFVAAKGARSFMGK